MENQNKKYDLEERTALFAERVRDFCLKLPKNTANAEYILQLIRAGSSPVEDRLNTFALFAGKFGYRINTKSEKEIANSLNQLLKDVHGKKEQNVLFKMFYIIIYKHILSSFFILLK